MVKNYLSKAERDNYVCCNASIRYYKERLNKMEDSLTKDEVKRIKSALTNLTKAQDSIKERMPKSEKIKIEKALNETTVSILTYEGLKAMQKRVVDDIKNNTHITMQEMDMINTQILVHNCYYCKTDCNECCYHDMMQRFLVPGLNAESNCCYAYKETSTFDNLEYKEDASIYQAALEAQHIKKKIKKQIEVDKEKEAKKLEKEAKKKHESKSDHAVSKRKQKKLKNRFDDDDGIEYSYKTKNFK